MPSGRRLSARWLRVLFGAPLLALLACTRPDPCAGFGAHQARVATVLFGSDVPGRGAVRVDEWAAFLHDTVTPRFPDGVTVLEGAGQWRDPRTGRIGAEPSRVLLIAADPAPATTRALAEIAAA